MADPSFLNLRLGQVIKRFVHLENLRRLTGGLGPALESERASLEAAIDRLEVRVPVSCDSGQGRADAEEAVDFIRRAAETSCCRIGGRGRGGSR